MSINEDVNDYDVYFTDKKSVKMVADYYTKKFNQMKIDRELEQTTRIGTCARAWVFDGEDLEAWKLGKKKLSDFAHGYADYSYSDIREWNNKDNAKYKTLSGMLLNTTKERVKIIINSDGVASENDDHLADSVDYNVTEFLDQMSDGVVDNNNDKPQNEDFRPVYLSSNAITLSNDVQLIIRFYGDDDEIHNNFDYIHATNYWTYKKGVVLNMDAMESLMPKELIYRGSKYPIASIVRARKFIKRGWNINAGQFLKMSFQISELDLTDVYVLEEQLTGVDSLYFLEFINIMKNDLEAGATNIDASYVAQLVERIFE